MPQLDIYLLTGFVWYSLVLFLGMYFINLMYVNTSVFFVLNFRILKIFVDKILLYFYLLDKNKLIELKIVKKIWENIKKILYFIKTKIIKKNFLNILIFLRKLYEFFNRQNNKINNFSKFNIEWIRQN